MYIRFDMSFDMVIWMPASTSTFHYSKDVTDCIGHNINRLFVPKVLILQIIHSFFYRSRYTALCNILPSYRIVTDATTLYHLKMYILKILVN